MKLNWKVRFKNKTFLLSFIATLVAFIYQILALFEVVPAIGQDQVMQLVTLLVTLLAGLGVVVDPTTQGINDSERAMSYTEPSK